MKKKLKVPKFKNEDEERNFWAKVDLADYYDEADFVHIDMPNLKPTSRSISIRIPEYIIDKYKVKANALDIPYQTLMKQALTKDIA